MHGLDAPPARQVLCSSRPIWYLPYSYPSFTWYFCVKTQKSPHLRMPQLILPNLPMPFMILTVSHYAPVPSELLINWLGDLSSCLFIHQERPKCSSRVPTHHIKFVVRAHFASCAYRSMQDTTPQCTEASWTFRSMPESVLIVVRIPSDSRSWDTVATGPSTYNV